jgi:hypothetical protein
MNNEPERSSPATERFHSPLPAPPQHQMEFARRMLLRRASVTKLPSLSPRPGSFEQGHSAVRSTRRAA